MTGLLVVNADDLGLTAGVCRAVARAHGEGVVTSTSVLAVGQAFDVAARTVRDTGGLGLGAHLALVGEDRPLLSAREVPSLVDRSGRFPLSYRTVVARGLAGRIDAADVAREFRAQLDRVLGIGVPVTHLDTHQHTHLWPTVSRVLVDLAREAGIGTVRLPTSARRGPLGVGVRVLAGRLRRRLRTAGLATTAGYAGLDEAGRLDAAGLDAALARATAAGVVTLEVNAHPGEAGDPDLGRFSWDYRWSQELELLCDPATRRRVERAGWRLGTFADLADAR